MIRLNNLHANVSDVAEDIFGKLEGESRFPQNLGQILSKI